MTINSAKAGAVAGAGAVTEHCDTCLKIPTTDDDLEVRHCRDLEHARALGIRFAGHFSRGRVQEDVKYDALDNVDLDLGCIFFCQSLRSVDVSEVDKGKYRPFHRIGRG